MCPCHSHGYQSTQQVHPWSTRTRARKMVVQACQWETSEPHSCTHCTHDLAYSQKDYTREDSGSLIAKRRVKGTIMLTRALASIFSKSSKDCKLKFKQSLDYNGAVSPAYRGGLETWLWIPGRLQQFNSAELFILIAG